MKKLICYFIFVLTVSNNSMAAEQNEAPPFSTITCAAENISIQVKIQHYRQTNGAGPASISSDEKTWSGGWSWTEAPKMSRLSGYHYLDIKAGYQNGNGTFDLKTLFNGNDLTGGWLEMPGFQGPVDCKEIKNGEPEQYICKVQPQNDCSISPKRLCCICENGQQSCY